MWRRERDSNPRNGFPFTRFPSVRLQPRLKFLLVWLNNFSSKSRNLEFATAERSHYDDFWKVYSLISYCETLTSIFLFSAYFNGFFILPTILITDALVLCFSVMDIPDLTYERWLFVDSWIQPRKDSSTLVQLYLSLSLFTWSGRLARSSRGLGSSPTLSVVFLQDCGP